MIHRLTIGVCLSALLASIVYLSVMLHNVGGGLICAWVCRRNATASWIVLVIAVFQLPLTYALARLVDGPAGYAIFIFIVWTLIPQLLLAIFGGYLGYACVEYSRQRSRNPNAANGKMIVIAIVTVAILLAASIAFSR